MTDTKGRAAAGIEDIPAQDLASRYTEIMAGVKAGKRYRVTVLGVPVLAIVSLADLARLD